MSQLKFLYFDLGNVLLKFDHKLACRQMGEVAGVPAEKVWDVVFASDLEARYESGQIDDRQFYDAFCQATDTRPDFAKLRFAGSAIFTPNVSIFPLVAALDAAAYRMGVLSDTCPGHWDYCTGGRYGLIDMAFDVYALSFRLGACKPAEKIFAGAAQLAGVAPQEIFYVDDIARHVAGARAYGFDAVQYTTTPQLVADLRARGIQFNY